MLSTDISEFFSKFEHLKKYWLGTFSIDLLPKRIPPNYFLICNTDTSEGPGKHWFALYRASKKNLECFDSLGVTNEKQNILKSIGFQGIEKIIFNESQVQPNDSTWCGQFAIFFLFERLHNLDFKYHDLVNILFTHNLNHNQQNVEAFFDEI